MITTSTSRSFTTTRTTAPNLKVVAAVHVLVVVPLRVLLVALEDEEVVVGGDLIAAALRQLPLVESLHGDGG